MWLKLKDWFIKYSKCLWVYFAIFACITSYAWIPGVELPDKGTKLTYPAQMEMLNPYDRPVFVMSDLTVYNCDPMFKLITDKYEPNWVQNFSKAVSKIQC